MDHVLAGVAPVGLDIGARGIRPAGSPCPHVPGGPVSSPLQPQDLACFRYLFGIGPNATLEYMSSTKTAIEWTSATWNVMTGCTQISAGCDHCYAKTLAERKLRTVYLAEVPVKDTPQNRVDPFAPRFWESRLDQPLRWKTPMRIFVN